MTPTAILLVTFASARHALWNLCAKRGVDKLVFVWASAVAGSIVLLGPVALAAIPPSWTPSLALRILVAAGLRAAYFVALTAAYSRGDLPLVYPLARGIAPALVPLLAVLLLEEAPGLRGSLGIAAIVAGVYVSHLAALRPHPLLSPLRSLGAPYARYAVLAGVITSAYSIVDKSNLETGIDPLWYAYLTIPLTGLLLTPFAIRDRRRVADEYRANRAELVVVGIMMPASYLLVLYALRLAPVSYVAPARELSIMFAAILGVAALREGHAAPRLIGAALIAFGVVLLALSRTPP